MVPKIRNRHPLGCRFWNGTVHTIPRQRHNLSQDCQHLSREDFTIAVLSHITSTYSRELTVSTIVCFSNMTPSPPKRRTHLFLALLLVTSKTLCCLGLVPQQQRPTKEEKPLCGVVSRRQALQEGFSCSSSTIVAGATGILSSGLPLVGNPSWHVCGATMTSSIAPITTLSDDTRFPLASFGLQVYNDDTAYKLTLTALQVGYRNFFASVLAGNQRGFAKAIRDSNIPRDELYICGSVVSNRAVGYDAAKQSTTIGWQRNMEAFSVGNIDYLDQIMLDYPGPDKDSIQGQWASFGEMHAKGLVKSLSVSNFSPTQLDYVLNDDDGSRQNFKVKPVVNQLPYSVAYHPGNVVRENGKRGVLVQAWAPLGGSLGGRFNSSVKGACAQIGGSKSPPKSWAQVALRWILQTGASFTTQSKKKEHFEENLDIFDFELTIEEMQRLSALA